MILIIILLLLPLASVGQIIEYEKTGSMQLDTFAFPTYILKIDNHSASDPAKVFIVPSKSFDSLTRQITKLYFAKKQEYNEYYVLGVEDMSQTQTMERAVTKFLNQIDSARAARKRSTFLKLYSWDNINNKIIYQLTMKNLSQVDNLYYLNSAKDICRYMACPKK
jgi:hypothetical protein